MSASSHPFIGLLYLVLAGSGVYAPAAEPAPPLPGLRPGQFGAPVTAQEAAQFAVRATGGNPPTNGLRYWSTPLWQLPCHGCYVSVLRLKDAAGNSRCELWENGWGDTIADRGMRMRRGPDVATLEPYASIFDGRVIDDVPVPAAPRSLAAQEPWTLAPGRGFTRPYMHHDAENGYVLMACVCPDYLPGSVSLMPALTTSKTGAPGTWKYHGMVTGEPRAEQERLGRPVWSDGGSLLQLADGTWRMYVNGFGQALAALHAETLAGPWRFLRDKQGAIRELIPSPTAASPFPSCFPYVLRVAPEEWHLWLSDGWPCQSVWHFWSRDGLAWELYGQQPEITRAAVNGHGIKCLRTYLSEDGQSIMGLLSVWSDAAEPGQKAWQLHLTSLPVGPPPRAP